MRPPIALLFVVLASFAAGADADSFKMKDGRYADGPVTVLALSDDQLTTVRTKRFFVLDPSQQARLIAEAGLAPSALEVRSLTVAGKDCTCFDFNIAIWFEEKAVEVPHAFLVSDAEAEQRMDEFEREVLGGEEP